MKKYLTILVICFTVLSLTAQQEGCDGVRYIEDVFSEVMITNDLKFGKGTTISGNFQELFLDVYEPVGDLLEQRPVIILAFGGSFIGGQKEDVAFLCEAYARKGFVAVSIDYRLYDGPFFPLPTGDQMKNVVIKAVSDMRAAIRFMREDAATTNDFRIDPDFIFVGGVSAGSITAFHTAVIDAEDDFPDDIAMIIEENGGIEGNSSTNLEYSSSVQGLVNFSGGLNDASWIDGNDPPMVSVHDDMDPVVPYGSGFATIFGIPIISMDGSGACHEVAEAQSIKNELKTIENSSGHVSFLFNPADIVENVNFTSSFLAEIVCSEVPTNTIDESSIANITLSPNPSSGLVQLNGLDVKNNSIEIYATSGVKLATYKNQLSLDLSFLKNGVYIIKINDNHTKLTHTHRLIISN